MSFYSLRELYSLGLKSVGRNVNISKFTRINNASNIIIGNNVRIDDFCILSSGTSPFIIEDYIHIAAGVFIWGNKGFHIKSFSNISAGCKIYTQSDSYCGNYLIGPTIDNKYRNVYGSAITLEKHVIIGAGSVVLPGAILNEGVAIGSNSLVYKECKPWSIYAGSPVKFIKERAKNALELEKELL